MAAEVRPAPVLSRDRPRPVVRHRDSRTQAAQGSGFHAAGARQRARSRRLEWNQQYRFVLCEVPYPLNRGDETMTMFTNTQTFSSFSTDNLEKAKRFYGDTL